MNAEFNWWLLIVGLAIGAGLVWLVLADSSRRDVDVDADELPVEAAWISATLADSGEAIDVESVERVLRLHRAYLAAPPPDEVVEPEHEPSNTSTARPKSPESSALAEAAAEHRVGDRFA
ncbi:MAG TPA: hypothetical protein VH723_00905 [Candidatus Limnocylindrales bacterium]